MASEDLDARKTALEDWIDSLSAWMIAFTWPVAVGLVMEFYAILNPAWTREWNGIIDRIGLLLVTAGVSGELAVEHKTHLAERKLRTVNADIEREAEAKLKAADERISEAQERAAAAGAEAARANLELAKIKTPRSLGPEAQERIRLRISPLSGTFFDLFVSPDAESIALMNTLDEILARAGWNRARPYGSMHVDNKAGVRAVSGVQIIRFIFAPELEPALVALAQALLAEGIAVTAGNWPSDEQNKTVLHVVVGSKPL